MNQLLVIIGLLILAEATYLVVKVPRGIGTRQSSRSVLLDTSVLIDGRIRSVVTTGFFSGTLVIPRSVVGELQSLADNGDHEKRARARFGLDVVTELQAVPGISVEILQDGTSAEEGVDNRLLKLAKKSGAAICTIDYNLNKVAVVEGITVLNVNELAQQLRMAYLPGETLQLELVQKGQDGHQAVGYLPDGTMVVVEYASKQIGRSVGVEIIRSLQTAAGRMMFARLTGNDSRPLKDTQAADQMRTDQAPKPETKTQTPEPAGRPKQQRRPASGNRRRQGRGKPQDAESELIDLVRRSE